MKLRFRGEASTVYNCFPHRKLLLDSIGRLTWDPLHVVLGDSQGSVGYRPEGAPHFFGSARDTQASVTSCGLQATIDPRMTLFSLLVCLRPHSIARQLHNQYPICPPGTLDNELFFTKAADRLRVMAGHVRHCRLNAVHSPEKLIVELMEMIQVPEGTPALRTRSQHTRQTNKNNGRDQWGSDPWGDGRRMAT